MKAKQTIAAFFEHYGQVSPGAQFSVYRLQEFGCASISLPPYRRDFYKISLMTKGEGILSYADRSIHVKDASITFTNPLIPYSWEPLATQQTGYFCLFNEDFIDAGLKNGSLAQSPLFKAGGNHIFFPPAGKVQLLGNIFENMLQENESDYAHKNDLLKSYVQIIMHEALKLQPAQTYFQPGNAAQRISELFLELLERQFPIDSPQQAIRLRSAHEYAAQLSVHTNHLNRALKEITGKTTTEWIAERIAKEARTLLLHSNWDAAQIGYCLGFEHDSNFNTFFKKHSGQTPSQFRKSIVSN